MHKCLDLRYGCDPLVIMCCDVIFSDVWQISGMSDYFSVLLRSEGVRDPELLAPPIDEDLPQGVMKRLVF